MSQLSASLKYGNQLQVLLDEYKVTNTHDPNIRSLLGQWSTSDAAINQMVLAVNRDAYSAGEAARNAVPYPEFEYPAEYTKVVAEAKEAKANYDASVRLHEALYNIKDRTQNGLPILHNRASEVWENRLRQ